MSGSGKSTLVTDILYQSLARHFYRAKLTPARTTASRAWSTSTWVRKGAKQAGG